MRLTKKMERLIDRRSKLANDLMDVCGEIDDFIEKNGLYDEIASEDCFGGVEIYSAPYESGARVKEAIIAHEETEEELER